MSLIVANRVQETCTSPGVGAVSLLGAVIQFIAFSSKLANGDTTPYVIADQAGINWEVGIGTYATAGNTLTRTTVLSSSNAGSLVNFSSGSQNVWVDYPAEYTVLSSNNASQVSGQALISGGVGVAPSWGSNGVTSFAGNSTGLTPTSATSGAITLAGTLVATNGGTGVAGTLTGISYMNGASAHTVATGAQVASTLTATSITTSSTVTAAELIASNGFTLNNKVVATTYTFPTGYNAVSAGPITINSGVVITVPSTQRWVVL